MMMMMMIISDCAWTTEKLSPFSSVYMMNTHSFILSLFIITAKHDQGGQRYLGDG